MISMKHLFITINILLISTVISSCSDSSYFKEKYNKNDQLKNSGKSLKVKDLSRKALLSENETCL